MKNINQYFNLSFFKNPRLVFKGPEKASDASDSPKKKPDNTLFNLPGDTPEKKVSAAKAEGNKLANYKPFSDKLDKELRSVLFDKEEGALKTASKSADQMKETAYYSMDDLGQWDMLAQKELRKMNGNQEVIKNNVKDNLGTIRSLLADRLDPAGLKQVMARIEGNANKRSPESGYSYTYNLTKIVTKMDSGAFAKLDTALSGNKAKNLQLLNNMLDTTSA